MAARAAARRLVDTVSRNVVDDIYRCSFIKQTGVSLKYMLDFGSYPSEKNLLLASQFLHKELPIRLAHRVAELEDLPYGLSSKAGVLKVRFLLTFNF
jgi:pyruvate dehydrogenase kinase 2/3/4